MTDFDDRRNAAESKFALEEEHIFKNRVRKNKLLAEWAAGQFLDDQLARAEYISDMCILDDPTLFSNIMYDLSDVNVNISVHELRKKRDSL